MKTQNLNSILLYLSIFTLFYFTYLVVISFNNIEFGIDTIRIFLEILTIPLLIVLISMFVYSIFNIFKTKDNKIFIILFLINLATILMLIITTIYQI
jgi:hypothetical protein